MGDLAETEKLFAPEHQNGDGVVPAELAGDPRLAGAITRIVETYGAAEDRSGKPGVDQARVDAFFAAAQEVSDWHAQAEADAATVLPLGDATGAAAAVFEAVREKVEDYFTRCRLAAFDERAAAALNPADTAYAELSLQSLDAASAAVAALPLALVGAGRALPLAVGLNPAWEARIAALRDQVVIPILGAREALTQAEWEDLAGRFAAHRAWVGGDAGQPGGGAAGRRRARAARRRHLRRAHPPDRRGPRRRDRGRPGRCARAPGALQPRPRPPAAQLRHPERLLLAPRQGHLPGRHALPRPAQLRALPARGRHGPPRRARAAVGHLPGVLRVPAPGRGADEHRRRDDRRRRRRDDGPWPQRHLLRPPGP